MLIICKAQIKQQGAVFHFKLTFLIWISFYCTSSHANTHTCTLLGQVPQEIIIQLQNEDHKCHPLPLFLSTHLANPSSVSCICSLRLRAVLYFCFLMHIIEVCPFLAHFTFVCLCSSYVLCTDTSTAMVLTTYRSHLNVLNYTIHASYITCS